MSAVPASPPAGRRPLWRGRALALVAIVLVALNLRTAVSALSPIVAEVSGDIPIGALGIGLLGMLPPLSFAVIGLFAPALHRRFGLEPVVLLALGAIVAGHLLRAASSGFAMLALTSTLTFAGMGVANVLLPPLVKTYFPDRIGLLTSIYATAMAVGATVPPLVAVPVADTAGWRISLGLWAVFVLLALLPMLGLAVRARRAEGNEAAPEDEMAALHRVGFGRLVRSRVAWAIMLLFGLTALNTYAVFAWLPSMLVDIADLTPAAAGVQLAVFAITGIVASLVVPALAARLRSLVGLVIAGVALFVLGYLGLLLVPGVATAAWVFAVGMGSLLFPLALVLINLRTRSHEGAVALSSFVQSLGYGLAALGTLALGALHDVAGSWTVPLLFLLGTAIALLVVGLAVSRPRMLEDDVAR